MSKIVLIGFAACYKSSAGKIVAKNLGYNFADVDKLIESKAGATVSEIFKTQGETVFRNLETETLTELADLDNTVVSCGGGSVMSKEFAKLAQSAAVVWLTATPKTVFNRLNGATRPLFDNLTLTELASKMAERNELYAKYATLKITTDARSSRQVADDVLKAIK